MSGRERLMAALLAFGLSGLLAVAVALKPNPRGLGTHQQLGFPPCTFRAVLDLPCPTCGMTTAVFAFARGEIFQAFYIQPAGAMFSLVLVLSAVLAFLTSAFGLSFRFVERFFAKVIEKIGHPA